MLPPKMSGSVMMAPSCRSLYLSRGQLLSGDQSTLTALVLISQRHSLLGPVARRTTKLQVCPVTSTRHEVRDYSSHRPHWRRNVEQLWHRPGCSWLNNDTDESHLAPRDPECLACKARADKPWASSPRELMWERKMEQIQKSPYGAALLSRRSGHSKGLWDTMLEGHNIPFWDRFKREGMRLRWLGYGGESGRPPSSVETMTPAENKDTTGSTGSQRPVPGSKQSTTSTSLNASAPTTDRFTMGDFLDVELVYDPITMRRVPKPLLDASKLANANDSPVSIPVKTFRSTGVDDAARQTTAIPEAQSRGPSLSEKAQPGSGKALPSFSPFPPKSGETKQPFAAKANSAHEGQDEVKESFGNVYDTIKQMKDAIDLIQAGKASGVKAQHPSQPPQPLARPKTSPLAEQKTAFETSWKKDRESKHRPRVATPEQATSSAVNVSEARPEMLFPQTTITNPALFKQDVNDRDGVEKRKYHLLHQRDRPYKHMSANELNHHRSSLLIAWQRKHQQMLKAETASDVHLRQEIEQQKAAMNKMENLARWRVDATAFLPVVESPRPTMKSAKELLAEREKAQDVALIREIQSIYDNAQPAPTATMATQMEKQDIKSSLGEYERGLAPGEYDYMTDQDNLEQELKQPKKILKSGYEEPTYYDKSAGSDVYSFTTGQDNLEHELARGSERFASEVSSRETTTQAVPHKSVKGDINVATNVSSILAPDTGLNSPAPSTTNKISSADRNLYQVLAWDRKDNTMREATASSSYTPPTNGRVLSIGDAMKKLHSPAKYLDYITKYQARGYEVVSGSHNLLVMKRVRSTDLTESGVDVAASEGERASVPIPQYTSSESNSANSSTQPAEGTPRSDSTTFVPYSLSPTGFLAYPPSHDPGYKQSTSQHSSDQDPDEVSQHPRIIRKQEPVFSGTQRTSSLPHSSASASASANDDSVTASSAQSPPPAQSSEETTDSEAEASPSDSHRRKRLLWRTFGFLATCYGLGAWFESRRGSGSGGGTGGSASHGSTPSGSHLRNVGSPPPPAYLSHRSLSTPCRRVPLVPPYEDGAMWTATHSQTTDSALWHATPTLSPSSPSPTPSTTPTTTPTQNTPRNPDLDSHNPLKWLPATIQQGRAASQQRQAEANAKRAQKQALAVRESKQREVEQYASFVSFMILMGLGVWKARELGGDLLGVLLEGIGGGR